LVEEDPKDMKAGQYAYDVFAPADGFITISSTAPVCTAAQNNRAITTTIAPRLPLGSLAHESKAL
jgi:hypothetical protein